MTTTDEARNRHKPRAEQEGARNIQAFLEEKVPYRAYGTPTKDALLRLRIHTRKLSVMPAYSVLYNVVSSLLDDSVALVFPDMIVKMYGRNLGEMVEGLQTHSVAWIREYDPLFWEFAPGEDDGRLACIEEIKIEQHTPINPNREAMDRQGQSAADGAEHGG